MTPEALNTKQRSEAASPKVDSPALKWLPDQLRSCIGFTHQELGIIRLAADELEKAQMDVRQYKLAEELALAELERVTKERDALLSQVACNHPRQYHDEPCPDCGWKEPE